jgi:hypothetical protein
MGEAAAVVWVTMTTGVLALDGWGSGTGRRTLGKAPDGSSWFLVTLMFLMSLVVSDDTGRFLMTLVVS